MVTIKDIVRPRKEVLEGKFQGVIQSHKVDAEEPGLENNPEELLRITYPSLALKMVLEKTNEKILGKSNKGDFLLVGPYGSGKTHTLVSLYHIFRHPEISARYLKEWGVNLNVPRNMRVVIFSTRKYDNDILWEPIFMLLGRKDILSEIKRFPTVDQIEKVIGDTPCAIFIDEIENWYGSLDPEKDAALIERNETFLEHLMEVANDPKRNLFVFTTFLEEKEGLKKIFNRTKPVRIDISTVEDRERVTLYRLFEDIDERDVKKIDEIVGKYVDKYSEPIKIEDKYRYRQRMIETYPIHPLLFDVLLQVYESATERQSIRGLMSVLADAIKNIYDKYDLLLLSDINENDFREIDLPLMKKYEWDLSRVKDIPYSAEIMKAILIFTLNDKTRGATESDVLLSIFSPTKGHTINVLSITIEKILETPPHYLCKEANKYLFRHDVNIFALLDKEKESIKDDDVKSKIVSIIKKDVFENKAFIYDFEEIPDDSKTKIVVFTESPGANDALRDRLNDFYKGKTWQNTYILVFPKVKSIFSFEISEKCRRLIAAEKLHGQVEDKEGKLRETINQEKKDIVAKIKGLFGEIVRWTERENEIIPRLIPVNADVTEIRERAKSDVTLLGDSICDKIKDKPNGESIDQIVNDFKKFRKYSQILDDDTFYSAIRNLHKDKRVIIEGERGKFYVDEIPRTLEPGFVLLDPKFYTRPPEPEGPEGPGTTSNPPIGPISERIEKISLSLKGNSPRVILSQVEAKSSENDTFEELKITMVYKFDESSGKKQNIMRILKQLPQEEASIDGEAVVWRKKDED